MSFKGNMFDSALLCKWSAASQLSTPSTGVFARYEPCQRLLCVVLTVGAAAAPQTSSSNSGWGWAEGETAASPTVTQCWDWWRTHTTARTQRKIATSRSLHSKSFCPCQTPQPLLSLYICSKVFTILKIFPLLPFFIPLSDSHTNHPFWLILHFCSLPAFYAFLHHTSPTFKWNCHSQLCVHVGQACMTTIVKQTSCRWAAQTIGPQPTHGWAHPVILTLIGHAKWEL